MPKTIASTRDRVPRTDGTMGAGTELVKENGKVTSVNMKANKGKGKKCKNGKGRGGGRGGRGGKGGKGNPQSAMNGRMTPFGVAHPPSAIAQSLMEKAVQSR